ncbi:MAG: molybdopterin molybdotransferase MoeA [Alphaproteobacteria bacterium]|nr:molybdopterin molybdotransferase MoeA [Alphaproteobacteria bacterium]
MISYDEARAIAKQVGQERGCKTEISALQDVVGRVCAESVKAPLDIQPFDNSAMDGYAVCLRDFKSGGALLAKTGILAAGDPVPEESIPAGGCVEIMTGAPVPLGADAVIPVELAEAQGENVVFKKRPEIGENIRKAGEDFRKGADVLNAGELIGPQHIMPLAALGIDKVKVYKKPRAVFLATGSELVEDLSQDLKSGQIYNSNRPYGLAALEAMGVECVGGATMPDDPDQFAHFLKEIEVQGVDLIISSGAVSAGKYDFVREGLEKAGAEIFFHKVKIKPGKPNLFARLPNGLLYFGLPGNPVATATGLRFFVQPCVRKMLGMEEEKPVYAKSMTPFKKRAGLRIFLKARTESWEDGLLTVDILEGQASFMVSPFLSMNCWATVSEDVEEIKAGDILELYSMYPHSGLI